MLDEVRFAFVTSFLFHRSIRRAFHSSIDRNRWKNWARGRSGGLLDLVVVIVKTFGLSFGRNIGAIGRNGGRIGLRGTFRALAHARPSVGDEGRYVATLAQRTRSVGQRRRRGTTRGNCCAKIGFVNFYLIFKN